MKRLNNYSNASSKNAAKNGSMNNFDNSQQKVYLRRKKVFGGCMFFFATTIAFISA